ncbi:DinB family protein [Bacillus canaveralius]|uniref:DinB family protein n=1 Tax=Bacillus canaveralius TaxID=1403243 RepID=A0A2N5GKM7_9BACI|nr:DinB family protein [Bacillus canaveralius]PLR82074.1 DinB family protein [Bacillus canaveralius]PLR98020.1 DinB family protein [Bacillus canaveralius]
MDSAVWKLAEDIRGYTLEILDSIPDELTDFVPDGFNNSVRWNAGHILLDQYLWFYHKIDDSMPLQEIAPFFNYGSAPRDWTQTSQPPSIGEIKQLLQAQIPFLKETFAARFDEKLNEESEHGIRTIGDVIPRTIYHEGLHTGTLISLRKKLLGK